MSGIDTNVERPDEMSAAILLSKSYLMHAFKGEPIQNIGLEEVRREYLERNEWQVTWGFNRIQEIPTTNPFLQMAAQAAAARPQRVYKVVTVDLDAGKGISIVNRKDD